MPVNKSDFLFAMDRLEDFRAVHDGEDLMSLIDALHIMMESVGISDGAAAALISYLYTKNGHGQEGGFLLGAIIGIMAHEHMIERE